MKIEFDKNDEQLALIKQMGSKNLDEAYAAQQAFAAFLAPLIGQYFNQADTTSFIYRNLTFSQDEDPSFPIELFLDVPEGYYSVWSQTSAGGLPTNNIFEPISEIKFTTYRLDSAISYLKKYARKCRLDVISKALERLTQEILAKSQHNAWAVILASLAKAVHNNNPHVYRSATSGAFSLDDFNKILTYFRRLNKSWMGGTSVTDSYNKATDMICSPEIVEFLRTFAYNPINTKAPVNLAPDASTNMIALPDAERMKIFNNSGAPEFFGISIMELQEFGKSQNYQAIFKEFAGSTVYNSIDSASANDAAFNVANDELILFLDSSKDFAYRAMETSDEDSKETFTLLPDDQFLTRSDKVGLYGHINEGRMVLDTRPIAGLIV